MFSLYYLPFWKQVSVSFCSVRERTRRILPHLGGGVSMEALQVTSRSTELRLFALEFLRAGLPHTDSFLRVNEVRKLATRGGLIEPALLQVVQYQPLNAVLYLLCSYW